MKIFALTGLIVLYAFAVGFNNAATFTVDLSSSTEQGSKQTKNIHAGVSKVEFCHTSGTGFSYNVITSSSSSPFNKNNFADYTSFAQAEEQALKVRLFQYDFFSKNLALRLSKYNLLFPFHYFS